MVMKPRGKVRNIRTSQIIEVFFSFCINRKANLSKVNKPVEINIMMQSIKAQGKKRGKKKKSFFYAVRK